MVRWQKLLRHEAILHLLKESWRNTLQFLYPGYGTFGRSSGRALDLENLEPRILLSGSSIDPETGLAATVVDGSDPCGYRAR